MLNNPLMRCFIKILLISVCVFSLSSAFAQSAKNQAGKIDQEIKQLAKEKAKKQKEKVKYEKLLKKKDQEIKKTQSKLSELNGRVKEQQQAVEDIKQQILVDEANIAETKEQKKALLVSAYKLSSLDYFELLFSQEDPNQTRRMVDYFAYFSQQRDDVLRTLNLSLTGLNEKQQELETTLSSLGETQKDYQKEKAQLESKNKERKRLISKLGKDISAADKKIAKLREDRKRVEELIIKLKKQQAIKLAKQQAELKKQQAQAEAKAKEQQQAIPKRQPYVPRKGGFAKQKGIMSYPVPGKFVRSYGSKIGTSQMTMNGVNIQTKPSTNVQAIYDGEVIFANVLKGFGNLIIIDHGNNYMSLYGNNDILRRQVGEEIAAGDVIAQTGSNTKQEHFYFEIRHKGKPINPASWFRR